MCERVALPCLVWSRLVLCFQRVNQLRYFEGASSSDFPPFLLLFLQIYLAGEANPYALDVTFNDDYTRIVASRFIIQTYQIKDANADKDMMEQLRKVAVDSPFNVTVFNPFFIFFDQVRGVFGVVCCGALRS